MNQFELASEIGIDSDDLREAVRRLENKGVLSTSSRSHYAGVPYTTLSKKYRLKDSSTTTTTSSEKAILAVDHRRNPGTLGVPGVSRNEPALHPRIHHLEAVAQVKDVFAPQAPVSFTCDGGASIEITFGTTRRKIDLRISQNKPGLTYDEYKIVLSKAWQLIEQKLNRRVQLSEFLVTNAHYNIDYQGLKLEGLNAVTLYDHSHWLARLYYKQGALRSELVLTGGVVTMDQAAALILQSPQLAKDVREIKRGVRKITKLSTPKRKPSEIIPWYIG